MKNWIAGILIALASLTANAAYAATANVTLTAPKEVQPGQMFQVVVQANGMQNADLIRLNGTFTPGVIEWVQAQPYAAFQNVSPGTTVNNTTGAFSFGAYTLSDALTGNAKLVAVTFRALKTGTATIKFDATSKVLSDGVEQTGTLGTAVIKVTGSAPEAAGAVTGPTVGMLTVMSPTHPDQNTWYANDKVTIQWRTEKPFKTVNTAFDRIPSSVDYQKTAGTSAAFVATADGIWYAHVRAIYQDGTSDKVDFLVRVDRTPPHQLEPVVDQTLVPPSFANAVRFAATDDASGIAFYKVFIDKKFVTSTAASAYPLTGQSVGAHTIKVEAYDRAGNMRTGETSYQVIAGAIKVGVPFWTCACDYLAGCWFWAALLLFIGLFLIIWSRRRAKNKSANSRKQKW